MKKIKRDSISIPKGRVIQIRVVGELIEDERLFNNSRKLIRFLNFLLKNHKGVKIKMKTRILN